MTQTSNWTGGRDFGQKNPGAQLPQGSQNQDRANGQRTGQGR